MGHQLRQAALIFAVAGQSLATPAGRFLVDYARPVTTVMQRVHNAALASPRWGNSIERLRANSDLRTLLQLERTT